jgi:hypothetical protein
MIDYFRTERISYHYSSAAVHTTASSHQFLATLLKLYDDDQAPGCRRGVRRTDTADYGAAWCYTGCAARCHARGQEQQLAAAYARGQEQLAAAMRVGQHQSASINHAH